MPAFAHMMPGALRGDGQAKELARLTDGQVADIDHLLDFAEAFLKDLAALQGDQCSQVLLMAA